MTTRLQALFVLALVAVLAAVGGVVFSAAGPWVGLAYVVLVAALLAFGMRRARDAAPPAPTCSCCTSTVHDSVRVV